VLLAQVHAQTPTPYRLVGPNTAAEVNLDLPRFDLNFPGGNPEALIEHINEKLGNSPVNTIIPSEFKDVQIPPMKLKNVTVQQVFDALCRASQRLVQTSGPTEANNSKGSRRIYTFQANQPAGFVPAARTEYQRYHHSDMLGEPAPN